MTDQNDENTDDTTEDHGIPVGLRVKRGYNMSEAAIQQRRDASKFGVRFDLWVLRQSISYLCSRVRLDLLALRPCYSTFKYSATDKKVTEAKFRNIMYKAAKILHKK